MDLFCTQKIQTKIVASSFLQGILKIISTLLLQYIVNSIIAWYDRSYCIGSDHRNTLDHKYTWRIVRLKHKNHLVHTCPYHFVQFECQVVAVIASFEELFDLAIL